MLNIYDLYDLAEIFKVIRFFPDYELNNEVLSKAISVLKNRHESHDDNQFRVALRSINLLDTKKFYFVGVDNLYVYFSACLKEENVYETLIECCECLLKAVIENNTEKIGDLADCLHNLPTDIVSNGLSIPKSFWKDAVKEYRDKWDKSFLRNKDFR